MFTLCSQATNSCDHSSITFLSTCLNPFSGPKSAIFFNKLQYSTSLSNPDAPHSVKSFQPSNIKFLKYLSNKFTCFLNLAFNIHTLQLYKKTGLTNFIILSLCGDLKTLKTFAHTPI